MVLEFFMPMVPPTVTAQEHKVRVVNGKPMFYDTPRIKAARRQLMDALAPNAPEQKMEGAVALSVSWHFPRGRHKDGDYKITRPDTDNLQKLLKDCMTAAGFWKDDAQVVREHVEKRWASNPGIYIRAEELLV